MFRQNQFPLYCVYSGKCQHYDKHDILYVTSHLVSQFWRVKSEDPQESVQTAAADQRLPTEAADLETSDPTRAACVPIQDPTCFCRQEYNQDYVGPCRVDNAERNMPVLKSHLMMSPTVFPTMYDLIDTCNGMPSIQK